MILAALEMGWLLSGPAFLVLQALVKGVCGNHDVASNQTLFRFRVGFSVITTVAWAIAIFRRPASVEVKNLPFACASVMGAFLVVASQDHLMYDLGIYHGQC